MWFQDVASPLITSDYHPAESLLFCCHGFSHACVRRTRLCNLEARWMIKIPSSQTLVVYQTSSRGQGQRYSLLQLMSRSWMFSVLCYLQPPSAPEWLIKTSIVAFKAFGICAVPLQAEMFSPLTQSENGNENTQVWDGVGWFRVRKLEGEETRIHLRCQLRNQFVPACNNPHFGTCGSLPGLFSNYTAKWLGSWSICSMQSGVREFIRRTSQTNCWGPVCTRRCIHSLHQEFESFRNGGQWELCDSTWIEDLRQVFHANGKKAESQKRCCLNQ